MRPKQQTLGASGFERYGKRTRREQLLADMNRVLPWGPLVEPIAPVYPKGDGAGRPPVGLERMLHTHRLHHWFNVSTGTIANTTIIIAPSSTKNRDGERDPEMHQTRKGNEWHVGMKAQIGVDSRLKLIRSVAGTAANVPDSHLLPELLHGHETRSGATRRIRASARRSETTDSGEARSRDED